MKRLRLDRGQAGPMELRDGYTGGRVNAIKLYYETSPGERIMYYDINSLYGTIMK